ncbi:hypothetical protein D3C81_1760880 [compost metagenome]
MHGGFRRAVGAGERGDQYAGHAADIDHQAFAAAQHRKQRPGNPHQCEHIGFELPANGLDATVE